VSNTSADIMANVLTEKRAELVGALERAQEEVARIVADIHVVDAALKMFAPHIEVETIAPKALPPLAPAARGEITMLALTILRETGKPMSTQDLNFRIMEARNLNTNDPVLVNMMRVRLHSSLRNHRSHKRVRSAKSADGKSSLWEIVR